MNNNQAQQTFSLGLLLGVFRQTALVIFIVSLVINLLMLVGPVYMLQIYDRILSSGSVPTLVVISLLTLFLYGFYWLLEIFRARILQRIGRHVEAQFSARAYRCSNQLPALQGAKGAGYRPVNDLRAICQFLTGPGPGAIFDIPWMPIYIGVVFLFHPYLGAFALASSVLILALVLVNELHSQRVNRLGQTGGLYCANMVEEGRQKSEVILAMGMQPALNRHWARHHGGSLRQQMQMADINGFYSQTIKTLRLMVQSCVLGLGAWLAIQQQITPGIIIAASIIAGRSFAPLEVAVTQWRVFLAARRGYHSLSEALALAPGQGPEAELPLPAATLTLEDLSCTQVGAHAALVHHIHCALRAGQGLGVIGPSGAGKTTLLKALAGLAPVVAGSVRYDHATLDQWDADRRGQFIGYLPQDIKLFNGTIAENIARFAPEADTGAVIAAAQMANVHEAILALPEGYDTVIGAGGVALSGGLAQRVGLARAVFGRPFLVLLDEPNSNLDNLGEAALADMVGKLRAAGSIVLVVSHRPSLLAAVDVIMVLREGRLTDLGPRDEILKKMMAMTPVRQAHA